MQVTQPRHEERGQPSAQVRVRHLVTTAGRRGAEIAAVELAAELGRRQLTNDVHALYPGTSDLPVPVLSRRVGIVSALWAFHRSLKPGDVVVAHGSRALPAAAVATCRTRVPFVYLSIGDPRHWEHSLFRRGRVRLAVRRAAGVVVLSPVARRWMVDHHRLPESRVWVLPNGRSSEHFRLATLPDRLAARRRLGLPATAPVVCVVGALTPEKRPEACVEAGLAQVGAQVVVAGVGPLRPVVDGLARRHPGRVLVLGSVADLRTVYWASDAIVMASTTEGLPGALIEAALCGVPAAAVDVGFVPDVVPPGAGCLASNLDELPVTLARVLAGAPGLGLRARAHCAAHFDIGEIADGWIRVLTSLVLGGVGPPGRARR